MDKTEIEDLRRKIGRLEKVVRGYEGISIFYRFFKHAPFVGLLLRKLANSLKYGKRKVIFFSELKGKNVEILGICHPEHRGVKSATRMMIEDTVEVSEVFSLFEAKKVAKQLDIFNPKKVVFSGYPNGYDLIAAELKKINPEIRIFFLIHSSFLWLTVYQKENKTFENILNLEKQGVVEKIGFLKRDLAEYFKESGHNSYFVMNRFEMEKRDFKPLSAKKIKIGVFGNNWWHRNILNQVIAALMIPNTEIHVNEIGDYGFIPEDRIVVHGFLPKEEFIKIYEEMDLNLYISLTDCFPMTLIESMTFGIPCLASDTSEVYSGSKLLREKLIVSKIDSPIGIKEKITDVFESYQAIQNEINAYLPKLHSEVEKTIREFLK